MIELAGSAAHVVVDDLTAPALSSDDEHHLARVLRLRPAERVSATDGAGGWRWCRWTGGGVEPDGEIHRTDRSGPVITIGFSIIKGDRLDWTVQKLTELGVDRLVPLAADQCVVRWDDTKAVTQVESPRGTFVRVITTEPDFNPSIRRDGFAWIFDFRRQPLTPQTAIEPKPEQLQGGDVTTAAVAHLAAGTPPEALFAVSFMNDWVNEHVAGYEPRSQDGFGSAPARPGLGIDVDVQVLGTPLISVAA